MTPPPLRRLRSVLRAAAIVTLLTMVAVACGGSGGDGFESDMALGEYTARDLALDRTVEVTYHTDFESYQGGEFFVRLGSVAEED